MNKNQETVLLLLGTLQASIKYLDDCLGLTIDTKPIFKLDLKMAAKNTLVKVESWLEWYYKKNNEDINEVTQQMEYLTDIYEKSGKIAFQLNTKGEIISDMFMDEFNSLIKKYKIEI